MSRWTNGWNKQSILKRSLVILSYLLIIISSDAIALPWIKATVTESGRMHHSHENNPSTVNYSGKWRGECNNQPVIDLTIEHQSDKIVLIYGFMEEKYTIGQLKSESSSNQIQTESSSSSVYWNEGNSALIFTNTSHYRNSNSRMTVFFSKVTLSLISDSLVINGEHFQSNNEPGEVIKEIINCSYHRVNKDA